MLEEQFLRNLKNALEMDEAQSLAMDEELTAIPTWDSIGFLLVTVMFETEFNLRVNAEAITRCKVVRDLFEIVKHGNA
jgi:acyl carrier protein